MKKFIPWWLKIILKIILSRLPISYSVWRRIGIFKHGNMEQAEYAIKVFKSHVKKSEVIDLKNKIVIEIGPGDSIATSIIAYSFGASSILIDTKSFANFDIDVYLKLRIKLKQLGYQVPNINEEDNFQSILKKTNSIYLTKGLESIKKIGNHTADLIFSQAVLEHIKHEEFSETIKELSRIQKKDGVSSHQIDLRDHLSESLNNLRFSKKVWESNFFTKSGFYTNRIGYENILEIFRNNFSNVKVLNIIKWEKLPISRSKLNKSFQNKNENDLLVKVFDVVLRNV